MARLVFLFALLAVCHGIVLDTLESEGVLKANSANTIMSLDQSALPGVLGGTRVLTAEYTEGADEMRIMCAITPGMLTMSSQMSICGACTVTYDGDGHLGFNPGQDFTADGRGCWFAAIKADVPGLTFAVTAVSAADGSAVTSYHTLESAGTFDLCVPFSGSITAYEDVASVSVKLDATALADVDAMVHYVCAQPPVSCWHTVSSANPTVGTTFQLSISCQNYQTLPETVETVTIQLPFDETLGMMDDMSISCDSAVTSVEVAQNILEIEKTLLEGETITCTVDVLATNAGNTIVQGTAETAEVSDILSNADTNLAGTIEFCSTPEASDIEILA